MRGRLGYMGLALLVAGAALPVTASAQTTPDATAADPTRPLTEVPGDAKRGREVLRDGAKATCLICHSISALPDRDQGMLGPVLDRVGLDYTAAELRARLIDARQINPETIMPPYFTSSGLSRVGVRWQGTTIYTAQEIEDVLAYLLTLRAE